MLSHGRNIIFDPSGFIECESCRLFKSQSKKKGIHVPLAKRLLPEDPSLFSISEIPEDLQLQATFTPSAPLDLVHSDGFQFDFPSGAKAYFFIFIDHVTDFRMVYSVPSRAGFLSALQAFHAHCFFYHKTNIKGLRMDNAGEMSSGELYEFARFHGIHIQRCAPYDHHQNGVSERAVRTAEESALTMLHHAKLSVPFFIMYAVINCVQIRNKCMTKKSGTLTPYELFTGTKARVEDIHPTGEVCYSFIKKDQRKLKYDPKARKCIFLCEDFERKAYLLMDVESRAVIESRDVRFPRHGSSLLFPALHSPLSSQAERSTLSSTRDESNAPHEPVLSSNLPSQSSLEGGRNTLFENSGHGESTSNNLEDAPSDVTHENTICDGLAISELAAILARNITREPPSNLCPPTPVLNACEDSEDASAITRSADVPSVDLQNIAGEGSHSAPPSPDELFCNVSENVIHDDLQCSSVDVEVQNSSADVGETSSTSTRNVRRKKNIRYFNDEFVNAVHSIFPDTPTTFRKAKMSPESKQWEQAMKEELESLHRESTWRLVPRTSDMFVVKSKWVFKIKCNEEGEISRFKARVVAMGFTQIYGVNYEDTYAPVLQASTRRLIFSLAADPEVTSIQADVETAFLQAKLDKVIHLEPPPGMDVPEGHVLFLHKAIYGLKQSPLLWYLTASSFFLSLGFKRCVSDVCLFILQSGEDVIILSIYVDDLTLSSKSKVLVNWVLAQTQKRFPVRDVKPLSWTVGIRVEKDGNNLQISQSAYIQVIFEKFICDDDEKKQRRVIPMAVDIVLHDATSDLLSRPTGVKLYQKLVGSLNYVAHASRPDVAFAVNALSRFLQKPRDIHMDAAKRVLIYLYTTRDLAINYFPSVANNLYSFCDASLVSKESDDGRSTTGYCIFYNNNIVAWRSCRQTTVSLSTMESELDAIATTLIALQHVRNVLSEIGVMIQTYTIYTDSLSAVKFLRASADVAKPRTRHLALRFHFIRSEVLSGLLVLAHVASKDQTADILTKPLPRSLFQSLREKYFHNL